MDKPQDETRSSSPPSDPVVPSPALQQARLTLARILHAEPGLVRLLAAAQALSVLDDVRPPLLPLPEDLAPISWDEGYPLAVASLRRAVAEAGSLEELARVSRSALELNWAVRAGGADELPQ
jgi:hypothetical protein